MSTEISTSTTASYARHRFFDSELGRFTQVDPLGYVDGPSAYQFAGYNPFSFGDPLGLLLETEEEGLEAIREILIRVGERDLASTINLEDGRGIRAAQIDDRQVLKWIEASRGNPVVEHLLHVLNNPALRIRLSFVPEGSLNEFGGAKARTVYGDGVWHGEIKFDAVSLAKGKTRVRGVDNTWIEALLLTSLVHEFGHVTGMWRKGKRMTIRILGSEGATAQDAVDREDELRRMLGAPLRGTHTLGLYQENWSSQDALMRMWCVEQGISSGTDDCMEMWGNRNQQHQRLFGTDSAPEYTPDFIDFQLPEIDEDQ